jgi:hypothetical protein
VLLATSCQLFFACRRILIARAPRSRRSGGHVPAAYGDGARFDAQAQAALKPPKLEAQPLAGFRKQAGRVGASWKRARRTFELPRLRLFSRPTRRADRRAILDWFRDASWR